jgi:ATP-dependent Lon protease
VPVNLRSVLFVGIANDPGRVHPTLMDRFQVFEFRDYSSEEKAQIIQRYIWPRVLAEVGLSPHKVTLSSGAVEILIGSCMGSGPGLRQPKRELTRLCRKILRRVVRDIATNDDPATETKLRELLAQYEFRVTRTTLGKLMNEGHAASETKG